MLVTTVITDIFVFRQDKFTFLQQPFSVIFQQCKIRPAVSISGIVRDEEKLEDLSLDLPKAYFLYGHSKLWKVMSPLYSI
jgi:hypothetical protein